VRHLFAVVVALLSLVGCQQGSPTSPSSPSAPALPALGSLQVSLPAGSCVSASPLPGWRNCRGTVTATINTTNQSGYVSVFFNYPNSGAFYHGDVRVAAGSAPGQVGINIVNDYVSNFVFPYDTTVTFYDAPQGAGSGPVIGSRAIHLTSSN